MITVRHTHPGDISYVINNLWERGQRELIGEKKAFDSKTALRERLLDKPLDHFYTVYLDDAPVVVMGASKTGGIYYTWFMATEQFSQSGIAITRHVSRFLREAVAAEPGARLELWSASDHPGADPWFKVLGFDRLPDDDSVFRKYLYVKNSVDYKA